MAHKFDPAHKDKLDNEERSAFYDLPELLRYFALSRGMVIADVGCGTGYCTFPMANRVGEKGKVLALDISFSMLETVASKMARWQVDNVIPLLSAENALPVAEGSIDFILLSLLVHELDAPALSFAEMHRILKKGGTLGIVEWADVESPVGPPLAERISLPEMTALLEKGGFGVIKDKVLGHYHYALLAGRPEEIRAEKIKRVSKKLVQELLCLREKGMRSAMLAERFNRSKTEAVVEILRELSRKSALKKEKYVEVMATAFNIDTLKKTLGLEKMSDIYSLAREKGYADVARLLMNPPPQGAGFSEYDFVEGRELFELTLGEKRSLSKSQAKDMLDRLLYDQDPTVIRNLLANPRLTERDVLKIASMRPSAPEVMKVIFQSGKWSSRYVVKRALVLNPCTPTGIALGLVSFMQRRDLKMIASDHSLHNEISKAAGELLKEKFPE